MSMSFFKDLKNKVERLISKNQYDKNGNIKENIKNFNEKMGVNGVVGESCFTMVSNSQRCVAYAKVAIGKLITISMHKNFQMLIIMQCNENGIMQERTVVNSDTFTIVPRQTILMLQLMKKDNTNFTDNDILTLKNSIQIEFGKEATKYEEHRNIIEDLQKMKQKSLLWQGSITGYPNVIELAESLNNFDKIIVVLNVAGTKIIGEGYVNENDFVIVATAHGMTNGTYAGQIITNCRFLQPNETRKQWRIDVTGFQHLVGGITNINSKTILSAIYKKNI